MIQPPVRLLIRGGTLVDGRLSKPERGDLRLRDGLISEIGPDLEPADGEDVFDATGCYVTPGLIESHTHFDGVMWWQPDLDPLPGCGVTSMVMGNCGFALAPVPQDPAAREQVVKIFSFFEDIPEPPFPPEPALGLDELVGVQGFDGERDRGSDQLRRLCGSHRDSARGHGTRGLGARGGPPTKSSRSPRTSKMRSVPVPSASRPTSWTTTARTGQSPRSMRTTQNSKPSSKPSNDTPALRSRSSSIASCA